MTNIIYGSYFKKLILPSKRNQPTSMGINLKFLTQQYLPLRTKILPNYQVKLVTKLLRLPIPPPHPRGRPRYIGILFIKLTPNREKGYPR